jgi:hypothetical protein
MLQQSSTPVVTARPRQGSTTSGPQSRQPFLWFIAGKNVAFVQDGKAGKVPLEEALPRYDVG